MTIGLGGPVILVELLVGFEATRRDVDVVFLALGSVLISAVVCTVSFVPVVVMLCDSVMLALLGVWTGVLVDMCSLFVVEGCASGCVDADAAEAFAESVLGPDGLSATAASVEVSMGRPDSITIDLSASFEDWRGS